MQLRYKFKLRCQLDRLRHSLDSVKILFRLGVGGWEDYYKNKTNLSQRLVEVEAELGKNLTLFIIVHRKSRKKDALIHYNKLYLVFSRIIHSMPYCVCVC